jgi:23S rRNA (cytosine1962-C5)-methyltransferase
MSSAMFEPKGWVKLAPGEDERLRDGHLWVYSNEITEAGGEVAGTDAGALADGDIVRVRDAAGRELGAGFLNRASKIAVRLLWRGSAADFDSESLTRRLEAAIGRRRHLTSETDAAVRLVNAEADLLPGLVVDRYADVVVVQTQILGWEMRREFLLDVLEKLLAPRAIVLKNDSPARGAEGLERYTVVARGRLEGNVAIVESGLRLEVDVLGGQKTGFYIDQRDNRRMVLPFVAGRRVLDCFCYTGAWSLLCARAGAAEVLGLDSSEPALALARSNAEANEVAGVARFEAADVFDHLVALATSKAKFDIVILDPPSLAKTKRALSGAERGYVHLNKIALGLLAPGGMVATCSCSHHVSTDAFREMLKAAAALARKQVGILGTGGQPADHPSLVGLPETNYLKCFLLGTV